MERSFSFHLCPAVTFARRRPVFTFCLQGRTDSRRNQPVFSIDEHLIDSSFARPERRDPGELR